MGPDTLKFILDKFGITDYGNQFPIDLFDFTRADMAKMFHDLRFTVGAEIGTEKGLFMETLCKQNPGLHLHCIDPWIPYDSGQERHANEQFVSDAYANAQRLAGIYECDLLRMESMQALRRFRNDSLDFVYIDGDHRYEPVINDLTEWSKKVRPGGIIAGHDLTHFRTVYMRVGQAVRMFTRAYKIEPWFSFGRLKNPGVRKRMDSCRSYMWVKI
jgi:hypothetical protein